MTWKSPGHLLGRDGPGYCSNLLLGSWGKYYLYWLCAWSCPVRACVLSAVEFCENTTTSALNLGTTPFEHSHFSSTSEHSRTHFSSTSPGKEASEIVSAPVPLGSGVFHLTFLSTWVRRRAPQQDPRTSLQLRLLRRLRNNRLASSSRLAPAKTATSASLSTAWLRS